jgi:hypothetical protein
MTTFGMGDNPLYARFRGSYANPLATIATKDIPVNIKQLFRLCRFYYHQDALLGALVDKMSEYPITQLVIQEKTGENLTEKAREKWDYLLNVGLDVRAVMKTINTDKYVYGNGFYYIYLPFVRYCVCQSCGADIPIKQIADISVVPSMEGKTFGLKGRGVCPRCGGAAGRARVFKIIDRKSEARQGLRLVRLNPMRMSLEYNPISGERVWYYQPQDNLRDGMTYGVRAIIDTTEMRFLEASYRQQRVKMNLDRMWVAQADGTPGLWEGWGIPPLFRVLEDVYYYKILRRANEALAQEHVTPLRVVSPAGTGDVSPQRTMNLADWQHKLRAELHKFKGDPNHILISPIPLNVEQIGGQARVMMVAAEMEAAARVIAAGLGCPIEMIWGGLNWSGASVSLRVLENHFINDRENNERLLKFLVPKLSQYYRMPKVDVKLAEFKMADDVQQQANAVNLMMQGFLSRRSVINEMGYDANEEFDILEGEHDRLNQITMKDNLAAAHMNTVIQSLEAKAQILMQFEMQIEQEKMQAVAERKRVEDLSVYVQQVHAKGFATPLEFDQSAGLISRLDPQTQALILSQWGQTMPCVVSMLQQQVQSNMLQAAQAGQAMGGVQGAQQSGAAAGPGMAPGASGPYSDGGDGSNVDSVMPGEPAVSGQGSAGQQAQNLPDQRPPTGGGPSQV